MNKPEVSPAPTLSVIDKKVTTKKRILQAALTCFADKGYHQTTTDEVVAESGLGKGTLYRYFKSKHELFVSLIDWFILEVIEAASHTWTDDISAIDKIRTIIMVTVDNFEQYIPFYKIILDFWAQSIEDEQVQHTFNLMLDKLQGQLSEILEEGIDSGEFHPVNARQVALALLGILDAGGFIELYWVRKLICMARSERPWIYSSMA